MNDTQELIGGALIMRTHFEKKMASLGLDIVSRVISSGVLANPDATDTFVISATVDGDNLIMWRGYGGRAISFAVGLIKEAVLVPSELETGVMHPRPPIAYYEGWPDASEETWRQSPLGPDTPWIQLGPWTDVTYYDLSKDPTINALLDDLIRAISENADTQLERAMVNFLKHPGVRDEQEVRRTYEVTPAWKYVDYRGGSYGIVHFARLGSPATKDDLLASHERVLLIKEIVAGPTPCAESATKSLRLLLDQSGYSHVTLRTSITPFRR